MLWLRGHLFGHGRSGGLQNGLRQSGFYGRERRRVHRVFGHVLSDAPSGLCPPAAKEPEVSSSGPNSKRRQRMSVIDQAKNAAGFIEDKTHEASFDKLIWMLRQKRDEAALQVPEWEELRDLASAIKEHTLSNLGHYLEMFEANAKRNGVTVHWARDGHEHNQIVYDILKSKNADTLIARKSAA